MGYFEDLVREGMKNPEFRRGWYEAKLEVTWQQVKDWFWATNLGCTIRELQGRPRRPMPPLEGWEHLNSFKGILEQTETGWGAYIEGVPGLGVAADTKQQCMDDLAKAFRMHREWYSVYPGPYLLYCIESTFPCTVNVGMPYYYHGITKG